ncbi:labile enterotoxin output A [Rahnella sp. AA]|uniref:LeoA/HP0731 family dynamin-like GTPase n=1 Tax=Rahnella sp. AA TaxID=2057180 RepID=UPI000C33CF96|nr:LeoA/HP0731 family dynamin-like GTPase [Rahnella sp. AA]PKE30713.1 labile enterotoxin output A [Rahnella sp. AA]
MEKTLNAFKSRQSRALDILNSLSAFLKQGEEFGIQMDTQLNNKLQTAIHTAANEKLKIALIGGFSEGKTSIAAAWMEKLDKASMNISHQESSNEIKVYDVGSDFVLIDTPGLFGFKEDSDSKEKYKDMTKKYVSEAHLILYVMNSTNPIKESHKEDLLWLFRTLNLLDRTVFVLSRFDEVADVEDEAEYQASAAIKYQNVTSRLQDLIALTPDEQNKLSIVAVAANPFDMGTEYWLSNPDKFRSLSHIAGLQMATTEKIQHNGGAMVLVEETRKSVVRDVLTRQLPVAIERDEKIRGEVKNLSVMSSQLKTQLGAAKGHITNVRVGLRTFVNTYFTDLILQLQGQSMETFADFFERKIGNGGIILSTHLQNEFDLRLQSVSHELNKIRQSYDNEVNHYNNTLTNFGRQGLDYVVKSKMVNNTTIIAARDGIASVAKAVGLDLGKMLNFKPWGAVNLAKNINGALAIVGLAIEAWDSWEEAKREKKFVETILVMKNNFEQQREELQDLLSASDFEEKFCGDYISLQQQISELDQTLLQSQERQRQFETWRHQAEAIDAEFTRIA